MGKGGNKRFCLVLVKPSHYDDDGYVIQWLRSPIPSTSLAALYGLAKDCAERHVLGPDVEIDILAFDETNTRIRCDHIAEMIQVAGAGMVMLVGVQSNQFPRAISTLLRACVIATSWLRSVAFMFPARSACSKASIPISSAPRHVGWRCPQARPKVDWSRSCRMPLPGHSSRSTIS